MSLEPALMKRVVEGALFAAGEPLNLDRLLMLFDEGDRPSKDELKSVLSELSDDASERGVELREVASGWRYQVKEESGPWVSRLWAEKPPRYSRAMLETIALIAYRQPITRGEIEEVRGVAVSSNIIKTLLEREWVRVVGHRDVPGKPALYATTREFLDYFNLKSLDELPTLQEIKDLDKVNEELALGEQAAEGQKAELQPGDGADGEASPEGAAEEGAPGAEAVESAEGAEIEAGSEESAWSPEVEEDEMDFSEVEAVLASVEETLHPKSREEDTGEETPGEEAMGEVEQEKAGDSELGEDQAASSEQEAAGEDSGENPVEAAAAEDNPGSYTEQHAGAHAEEQESGEEPDETNKNLH